METAIRGYVDYGFDAVIKFGGSLLIDAALTPHAVTAVETTQKLGKRVLVIPGGGPADKAIEAIDKRASLEPDTHHRACARAQDQTGLMICDKAFSRILRPCETLAEARRAANDGSVPVLLPSSIVFAIDPFERTWEITSDGMAVWFAWLVSAPMAMILTNVDGIYEPGTDFGCAQAVPRITATRLITWGGTSVDKCVAEFALRKRIPVWVGNGGYSDRLGNALCGKETVGTFVDPD